MKIYKTHLSISGNTETLEFINDVMSLRAGDDKNFISLGMPVFKEIFSDRPAIVEQMDAGDCIVVTLEHSESTVELVLESSNPLPYGFLYSFSQAFYHAPFTVFGSDINGDEVVLHFKHGDCVGGGYTYEMLK